EALEVLDPVVDGAEFVAVEAVHAAPAFAHDTDEADLAEDGEVLGDLGLGPAEFGDEPGDVELGPLGPPTRFAAGREGAEDFAAGRLGDGGEGVGGGGRACHAVIYSYTGICQGEFATNGENVTSPNGGAGWRAGRSCGAPALAVYCGPNQARALDDALDGV